MVWLLELEMVVDGIKKLGLEGVNICSLLLQVTKPFLFYKPRCDSWKLDVVKSWAEFIPRHCHLPIRVSMSHNK